MSQSRVAQRYAKALIDLSKENGSLEAVYDDIQLLKQSLESSSELSSVIKNPVISQSKKKAIFTALFEGKMNQLSFSFLKLILTKRREFNFLGIANSFIEQYNEEKGLTKVLLTTAAPVSDEAERAIVEKLKETAQLKNIELEKKVNPELIGGFIVEFNDRILDKSIQSNLQSLKRRYSAN